MNSTVRDTSRPGSRKRRSVELPRDPYALLAGPEVMLLIGCSSVTLWRWVRRGLFPQPDRLLPGKPARRAWKRVTVENWIDAQFK